MYISKAISLRLIFKSIIHTHTQTLSATFSSVVVILYFSPSVTQLLGDSAVFTRNVHKILLIVLELFRKEWKKRIIRRVLNSVFVSENRAQRW